MSDDDAGAEESGEAHPRGTLFLMLLFLALIAVLWIWMYVILVAG